MEKGLNEHPSFETIRELGIYSGRLADNLAPSSFYNLKPPAPYPSYPAISMEDEPPKILVVLSEDGRVKTWVIIARNDISEGVAREWIHRLKIGQEGEDAG